MTSLRWAAHFSAPVARPSAEISSPILLSPPRDCRAPRWHHAQSFPPSGDFNLDFGPLGVLASVLFQAISLGAIAMLLTAFLHPQLDRVGQAALRQPFAAGSLGLLTVFLAPLAIVILAITLILIPLALAAAILLALAWLFGVVALGPLGWRTAAAGHAPNVGTRAYSRIRSSRVRHRSRRIQSDSVRGLAGSGTDWPGGTGRRDHDAVRHQTMARCRRAAPTPAVAGN